jgi:hypothetical protein
MKKSVVMKGESCSKETPENKSILDAVRSAVDANLRAIHDSIVKNLYNELGVEPRELFCVEKYEMDRGDGSVEKGYIYNYARNHNNIRSQVRAKVDENGRMIDAIHTK